MYYVHDINPIAIEIGPIKIFWYGLMYLFGFLAAWWLGVKRSRRADIPFDDENVADIIFYGALGVVLGGRLGYMLFYYYPVVGLFEDPLAVFRIYDGGMSFHGGLVGVMVSLWLFARKLNQPFFCVLDFVAPLVPIGLGLGRIGNFINGELWGRVTDVPWAMIFPQVDYLPRHPSQLYECLLEGLVMFIILWVYSTKPRPLMAVSGLFSLLYGCFRFLVEFVRQPDEQLGFVLFNYISMGQLLSLPLIILGLGLMWYAHAHVRQTQ